MMKERMIKFLPGIAIAAIVVCIAAAAFFLQSPEGMAPESVNNPAEVSEVPKQTELWDGIPVAGSSIGEVIIEPLVYTDRGVSVDSTFMVKTSAGVTEEDLKSYLRVKDGTEPLEIKKTTDGDNAYTLSFPNGLKKDRLYNLVYSPPEKHPLSFAFQTESGFGVKATLPGKTAYSVPVNSGIEIYFNARPAAGYEDFITIYPDAKGTFELVGNTAVFIPAELNYGNEYTVTVMEGLLSEDGETLEESYVFSFNTEWNPTGENRFTTGNRKYETFLYEDDIFLKMSVSEELYDNSFQVDIYSTEDYESFLSYESQEESLPGNAQLIHSLTAGLIEGGRDLVTGRTENYIPVPAELAPGYYFFKVSTEHQGETLSAVQCAQVTGLSVYSLSLEGEMCFWVMDSHDGTIASGAVIEVGGKSGITGPDGVARIAGTEGGYAIVTVKYGDYPVYVHRFLGFDPVQLEVADKYYAYLYTDRREYNPDDTVDVYGVIRPVREEYALTGKEDILLSLGNMQSHQVTPDEYGVFTAKFPVSGMYGGATVTLEMDGSRLAGKNIQFHNYDKTGYIITAAIDKSVYYEGETIVADLLVTAYDGTPVEGVELAGQGAYVVTNANGLARAEFIAENPEYNSDSDYRTGAPYNGSYSFRLVGNEDYMQSVYISAKILTGELLFTYETEDGNAEFTVKNIDAAKLRNYVDSQEEYPYYVDPEIYLGAGADLTFQLDLYKKTYVPVEIGEHYDYIRKITVKEYDYTAEEDFVDTYQVSVSDGMGRTEGFPRSETPEVSYYGVATYKDAAGFEYRFTVGFDDNTGPGSQLDSKSYYFNMKNSAGEWSSKLQEGELGKIHLLSHNSDWPLPGQMIVITSSYGILNVATADSAGTVQYRFLPEHLPGVNVYGAYYDGKNMYPVQYAFGIRFDYEDKKLNFEFVDGGDGEEYGPGDEVLTRIRITDSSGKPKRAMVNLSVVDEAAFGESNYYGNIDFISSLYFSTYLRERYNVFSSCSSYYYSADGVGGAEKGGGGDEYTVRDDFCDNPAFMTVESDASGIAEFKYTIADTVTSWGIMVHAVSKDGYAGNQNTNIIGTLPYYIDLVMLKEFIAGDDICLIARPSGKEFKRNVTRADFTVEIYNDDGVLYTQTSSAAYPVTFNAGALEEGEYKVLVKSDCHGYKDAMEETITVRGNDIMLPLMQLRTLEAGGPAFQPPHVLASPVEVTFLNGDLKLILDTLYSCMVPNAGRNDEYAAYEFGNLFLTGLWAKENQGMAQAYLNKVSQRLNWYNGIPEVQYGDGEPLFTARFAAGFPELVKVDALYEFLFEHTNMYETEYGEVIAVTPPMDVPGGELERAAGYLALSAAGEKVLLEVYDQIEIIKNNEDQARFTREFEEYLRVLYYGAALCALGDDAGAAELLGLYAPQPELFDAYEAAENKAYYKETVDTMMLFINATINPKEAYTYLRHKEGNVYVSDVPEKINFIRKAVPASEIVSTVAYTLDGKENQADLVNYDTLRLQITRAQFDSFNPAAVEGNTIMRLNFYGGSGELDASLEKITLEKSIQPAADGAAPQSWQIIYNVTLPETAEPGYYTIRDRVPSNFRYAGTQGNDSGIYINNEGRQMLDIGIWYSEEMPRTFSVTVDIIKISDAHGEEGAAYIGAGYPAASMWGVSR